MNEKVFDFGKNYVVLDYKIKKLKETSASSASFDVDSQSQLVTLKLFNNDNTKIAEASFTVPLDDLIVDVELDSDNKKLVLHKQGGTTLECDFSQLIFKDEHGLVALENLPKEYNSDFTIKPTIPSQSVGQSQNSNKIILQSSILKALTCGPAYYLKSGVSLTSAQQGFTFSSDGLKLFVVDTSSDTLFQYTLSTAWDVNAIVLPASVSLDILSLDGTINGLYFKPDGTKIFMIGSGQKRIVSAALSTPWDITSLAVNDFAITTGLISNKAYTCMFMSSSGTKVYVGNSTDDTIDIYTTSTPWDLGTILETKVASIAIVDQENSITGLFISSDGQSLFIVGSGSDAVYQYTLDEAWGNVATYADKSVAAQQGTTTDIYFKPDGTRMYLLGTSTRKIDEYVVPEPWDLAGGEVVTKEVKDAFYAKTIILDDGENSAELNIGHTEDGDEPVSTPLIKVSKSGVVDIKKLKTGAIIDSEGSEGVNGQVLSIKNDNMVWSDACGSVKSITWQELKDLRDDGELIPGQQYRITDYITTTTQADTQSAGHQFDIIVTADDESHLNENARACVHENDTLLGITASVESKYGQPGTVLKRWPSADGSLWAIDPDYVYAWGTQADIDDGDVFNGVYTTVETPSVGDPCLSGATYNYGDVLSRVTYFSSSKLEAWKISYCLDNDITRFAWADTVNGKGVIYRMIDEFNNDCPYDFKNIQFIRKITDGVLDLVDGVDTWVYTFTGFSYENNTLVDGTTLKASEYFSDEGSNLYKNNVIGIYEVRRFQEDGFDNILETLSGNVFIGRYGEVPYVEDGPAKIVLFSFNNNLGRDCYSNTFGDNCYSNTFGDYCYSNTFGDYCYSNTFGNYCQSNTFGDNCYSNTFGNYCQSNTLGNSCYSNTFGDYCQSNTLGNYCTYNTFGNDCYYLKISENAGGKKYLNIDNGLQGASSANQLELYDSAIANKSYQVNFKQSATGKYLMLWANDDGTVSGKVKATNMTPTWSDIVTAPKQVFLTQAQYDAITPDINTLYFIKED